MEANLQHYDKITGLLCASSNGVFLSPTWLEITMLTSSFASPFLAGEKTNRPKHQITKWYPQVWCIR